MVQRSLARSQTAREEPPVNVRALARLIESSARPSRPLVGYAVDYPEPCPVEADIHNSFEVGILLEGEQQWYYEDMSMPLLPGDIWLAAAWEPHGCRTTVAGTRLVVLIFLPEVLGEEKIGGVPWLTLFAAQPHQRPRVTTPEMRKQVLSIGREIAAELAERRPAWLEALRLGLLRALFAVGRQWARGLDDALPVHAQYLHRLMPAIELVQSDPGRRVSLEEAAAACCLSVSQFAHSFRLTMGVSFGRFALRSRLAHVARLLLFSDLSVERIAHDLGFVSGSHLQLLFRKHYGCTPGRYRKAAGQPPGGGG